MKKRKKKKIKRVRCVALVPADTQAIRKRLLKELKSAERRFQKAQTEHERYREVDVPAYQRWHHVTLGPLEQELQMAHQEYGLFSSFLAILSDEQAIQGRSARQLLIVLLNYAQKHHDGRETNRLYDEWSPAFLMECAYALWQKPREIAQQEQEDAWRRQREAQKQARTNKKGRRNSEEECLNALMDDLTDIFLGATEDEEEDWSWGRPKMAEAPHRLDKEHDQEFRALYRRLCRALHPDVAGESTPDMLRLWIEVQDAHDACDYERMEALYAAWEMKTNPQAQHGFTCARIIAATRECLAGLRSLRRDLRAAKKHVSWRFSALAKAKREQRAQRLTKELQSNVWVMKGELEWVRREYRHLLERARRPPVRKPSKRVLALENDLNQMALPF